MLTIEDAAQWGGCGLYALEVHRLINADYFLVTYCDLGFLGHLCAVKNGIVYDSQCHQDEENFIDMQLQSGDAVYEIPYQELLSLLIEHDWRDEGWLSMQQYTQEEIHSHIKSLYEQDSL
jgi:hypothetical protein